MAVAAKQKRSSRRPQSAPDDDTAIVEDRHPVAKSQAWSAVETSPGRGTDMAEPDRAEWPGSQDPLLTKIGTRIALASLIFDGDWYQSEYPDVAAASMDPVRHYFDNGSREGRNPNRYFDTNWYASNNPDVAAAGLNPFLHYLLYGAREGRKPAP